MKKFLTTAMVLGALYGTANAAPITSPIYMPEAGKILSNINLGYTSTIMDEKIGDTDEYYKAMQLGINGKIGVNEKIAINYGFNYDFARKILDKDYSARFVNNYFGVTGRVYDVDANKIDLILNLGDRGTGYPYAEFDARYGLELSQYNAGLSVGFVYNPEVENAGNKAYDSTFDFVVALENEFILSDQFTIGLDLNYKKIAKDKKNDIDSYNEYGFNIDANYAVAENNYVSVYFGMDRTDLEHDEDKTYNFGVKYVTQF